MTTLVSKGRITRAIVELQAAFDRAVPLRGDDAPVYQGPRGTHFRSGRRSTGASSAQAVDSVPRWR